MTSDIRRYGNEVWDRLFQALYPCDESVTDAEVDADLKKAGIDMRPANARLRFLIDQKKAQSQLQLAQEVRASALERVRNVVAPRVENLRAGVQDLISRLFPGPEQALHFHKLEKAATDEDLQSLMDDLNRLASLRQSEDEHERPAQ
jgi:hypothetical protein